MRLCSWKNRKTIVAGLRRVYTAVNAEAAAAALNELEEQWGNRYPGVIRIWRQAWEEFTPFLRFPPELRKVVYTTNVVESVHYQLRKVTKTRGHFPTDQSALALGSRLAQQHPNAGAERVDVGGLESDPRVGLQIGAHKCRSTIGILF